MFHFFSKESVNHPKIEGKIVIQMVGSFGNSKDNTDHFLFYFFAASPVNRATELRCQCIKLESKQISTKIMANLEVIPSGPHCQNVEVM